MTPNSADSSARVFSPESAVIATRALNSALCCFLFIPTSHAPLDRLAFSLSRCPKIRSRRSCVWDSDSKRTTLFAALQELGPKQYAANCQKDSTATVDLGSWYGNGIDESKAVRAAALSGEANRSVERDRVREIAGNRLVEGHRLRGIKCKEIVRIPVSGVGRQG